ncbi:MAG: hypothetical protein PVI07_17675 [Anaerolineae bacterium]
MKQITSVSGTRVIFHGGLRSLARTLLTPTIKVAAAVVMIINETSVRNNRVIVFLRDSFVLAGVS